MSVTPEQARAAAIAHIERYVLRGDSYESLKESQMGAYSPGGNAVNIGSANYSCPPPKKLGADAVNVMRVAGVECCFHFSLRDLYDEIKSGTKQLSLFEGIT